LPLLPCFAKVHGATAIGVDLNPERVREAKENARRAGVEDKVEFKQQDLFETDIGEATVLTMYLLSNVNMKLRSLLPAFPSMFWRRSPAGA
jgi:tRNA G37 N-methylase Trm5